MRKNVDKKFLSTRFCSLSLCFIFALFCEFNPFIQIYYWQVSDRDWSLVLNCTTLLHICLWAPLDSLHFAKLERGQCKLKQGRRRRVNKFWRSLIDVDEKISQLCKLINDCKQLPIKRISCSIQRDFSERLKMEMRSLSSPAQFFFHEFLSCAQKIRIQTLHPKFTPAWCVSCQNHYLQQLARGDLQHLKKWIKMKSYPIWSSLQKYTLMLPSESF